MDINMEAERDHRMLIKSINIIVDLQNWIYQRLIHIVDLHES